LGLFDNVPVVSGIEDAAGTAATGTVDTLIADPGNSLLGVNADNMGLFEENAAGSKAIQIVTLGLAGEGGIVTDLLTPGMGKPGEGAPERRERQRQQRRQSGSGSGLVSLMIPLLLAGVTVVVLIEVAE